MAADLASAANDGMAELVSRYPGPLPGLRRLAAAYDDPEAAAREAVRALDQLGARGIQMFTNVHGVPIVGAAATFRSSRRMAARDLPIWMHPYRGADMPDYKTEERSEYRNLVDLRLAVRNQRGDGAARVRRLLRPVPGR